jgi:hypothetical protein
VIPGQPIYPYVLAAPPPPMPPAPRPAIRPPIRNNTPHPQGPPSNKPQSLQGLSRLSMVGSSSAPSSPPGRRREEGRGESTWPPPSRSDRGIWGPDPDPMAGPSDRPGPEHDASYYSGEPGFLDQPWRVGGGGGVGVGRGSGGVRDQERDRERDMRDLWPRNDRSPGPIGRPVPSTSQAGPPRRGGVGGAGGVGAPGPSRGYTESTDRYWRC